ncbi:hypothetical protein [Jiella sp. M17.18]|uniref:hypothetical protein n=1 Tax=Jiella sp. M17.18 TaxID=3234247 RepID=UPI0034E02565
MTMTKTEGAADAMSFKRRPLRSAKLSCGCLRLAVGGCCEGAAPCARCRRSARAESMRAGTGLGRALPLPRKMRAVDGAPF